MVSLLTWNSLKNSKRYFFKNGKRRSQIANAQRKIEDQRKRVQDSEKQYAKFIERFKGLKFSDESFNVKVLETVNEFMEEADTLKHCLFVNEYYAKKDSLILSARIGDERIETVEVSLSKMKVIQSRGLKNEPTDYHDLIIDLVHANLNKIADRLPKSKIRKLKKQQQYVEAV